MDQPQNLTELKAQLEKRLEEVQIAASMANYNTQQALNEALDIKSNKKLIVHFKKNAQYLNGIIAVLGEHSANAIGLALKTLDILEANDPRSIVEDTVPSDEEVQYPAPDEETL